MAIEGLFFNLPNSTLQPLLTSYLTALTQVSTAGQSYSIGGRSFTRAHIAEIQSTISELQAAIDRNNGARITRTFANMNQRPILGANPVTNPSAPGG